MTSNTRANNLPTAVLMAGSALGGALLYAGLHSLRTSAAKKRDPEVDHSIAHEKVWGCIGSALSSSMLYVGHKLDLYKVMREMCLADDEAYVTAVSLAEETGYQQRWLREWLAQQASMGILTLLPGTGDDDNALQYRLPKATAEVLADPTSKEYDIAMIQLVPSLVNRSKTMLPEAFETGIGRPYDEPEVAKGIDEQHQVQIRNVVLPTVIPGANNGTVHALMTNGCAVADLGCGAGNLAIAMARAYPKCTVHGYEVSDAALDLAATNIAKSKQKNVVLHNATTVGESLGDHEDHYDIVTTLDVLHDAPNPTDLIAQVRKALKPKGVWLLADIDCKPTLRENITDNIAAATMLSFSTTLCMSCSLSTKDGEGLGTLGFTVPVAEKMLKAGGFTSVTVLLEQANTRWFVVS